MHIHALNKTQAHAAYRAYLRHDFPDDERKPWIAIDRAWRQGKYFAYGLYADDGNAELLGYAFFCMEPERRAALLDYFAIVPDLRDKGYGGFFLQALHKELVPAQYDFLWIEAENPAFAENDGERHTQERRVAFYQRNGAVDTGLRYLLFGVHYVVLALCDGEAQADALREMAQEESLYLYRHMMPEFLYKRNFAIEP